MSLAAVRTPSMRRRRPLPILTALAALALLPTLHGPHLATAPLAAGSAVQSDGARIDPGAFDHTGSECALCVGISQARTALVAAAAAPLPGASAPPGSGLLAEARVSRSPDLSRTPPRGPPARG